MNRTRVVLVFGVPGVGKTTLITEALNELFSYKRLSGGSLINAELSESERDQLRKMSSSDILFNQKVLVHNFKKYRARNPSDNILFDGHCAVKHEEGILDIPVEIIEALEPDKILFLKEDAGEIIKRRNLDKERPGREVEEIQEIEAFQSYQRSICENYATTLGVPVEVLDAPSVKSFVSKITV